MRGPHPAAAERNGADGPAGRADLADQPSGGDDIGNGIPGADFVERHVVRCFPMHPPLGLGELSENAGGMAYGFGIECRLRQRIADRPPRRVVVCVVICFVIVGLMFMVMMAMMVVVMPVAVIMRVVRPMIAMADGEAAAGEDAVVVGNKRAVDALDQRAKL